MGFSRQEYWSGVSLPSPNSLLLAKQIRLLLLFIVTTIAQRPLLVGGFFRCSFHFLKLSNSSGVKVKVKSLSRVRLFATPWTVAHQAPPSMGFSRQEYWSGIPFPSPGDLPNPGIENPRLLHWQADSSPLSHPGSPFNLS